MEPPSVTLATPPDPPAAGASPQALPVNHPEEKPRAHGRRPNSWREEIRGLVVLLLAVMLIHSLIAKPFYIPSESMMPTLIKGDRLIVSKFPYGWSYVSPSLPDPVAIFRTLVLRESPTSWGLSLPPRAGRLFGRLPQRGDIVIVTHPVSGEDYIKRVIGLPGDRIELRGGVVILNGRPLQRESKGELSLPVDPNLPCVDHRVILEQTGVAGAKSVCLLPIVRETLPDGRSYDTSDLGYDPEVDDYGPIVVPADQVFLLGDNRDRSADSRVPLAEQGFGGPVPIENIGGRAEIITFSIDGSASWWNPISWWRALRNGRTGSSLRPAETAMH